MWFANLRRGRPRQDSASSWQQMSANASLIEPRVFMSTRACFPWVCSIFRYHTAADPPLPLQPLTSCRVDVTFVAGETLGGLTMRAFNDGVHEPSGADDANLATANASCPSNRPDDANTDPQSLTSEVQKLGLKGLCEGSRAEVCGLVKGAQFNGRLVLLGAFVPDAQRFEVPELNIRVRPDNLHTLASVEERMSLSFGAVQAGATAVLRCSWCRTPLSDHMKSACKCEMAFCQACHYVARNAGHALLCKKGLILCKIGPSATLLVRTLRRSEDSLLDTARIPFAGATDLLPGSGVVCLRVTPPAGSAWTPYRCAMILRNPGTGFQTCVTALLRMLEHMSTCSLVIRSSVSEGHRGMHGGRQLSISVVVPNDGDKKDNAIEHLEITYTPVDADKAEQNMTERVHIDASSYDASFCSQLDERRISALTPEIIQPIAHMRMSRFLKHIVGLPPEPRGACVGAVVQLTTDRTNIHQAWRLEAYDEVTKEWTVVAVRFDAAAREYVPHKQQHARTVHSKSICVDYITAVGTPRLFRTMWNGHSVNDIALAMYATLPLPLRSVENILICEAGEVRTFKIPQGQLIALPQPFASYSLCDLRDMLTTAGGPDQLEAGETAAEICGILGIDTNSHPQGLKLAYLDEAADRILRQSTGRIEDISSLMRLISAADLLPTTHSILTLRTDANTRGLTLLQGVLTQGESLILGRGELEVKQAAWIAFQGGGSRGPCESTFRVGRATHTLDAAKRMILDMCDESLECALCLEPLLGSASDTLTCGHSFHLQCLRDMKTTSCALCRTPVRLRFVTHPSGLQGYDDLDVMDLMRHRVWGLSE